MNTEYEVIQGIEFIIKKYVNSDKKKHRYLNELKNISPPPIRGIFSEMKRDGIEIEKEDMDIVHDAFFYFG